MRPAPQRPGPRALTRGSAALLVALALVVGGCSGGGDEPDDEGRPEGGATEVTKVPTVRKIGKVRGRLDHKGRVKVARAVSGLVEEWSDRAYGGEYPRTDHTGAFERFTPDARALARKRRGVLTNAGIGADLESVTIVRRTVRVDVAAPRGRLAGATARFRIVLDLVGDDLDRREVVNGRLLVTPTVDGWRVFGFDVRRSEEGKGS
ncbi:hypothetical protein L615_001500000530 [Nocardioides sp. J9]|uniref:hypothetical protein n=1 Tax=unclassified Nocardioides TaxID=2615069 RepID=UPI0011A54F05|nr:MULTISPECIES: hypothetical protein [unclassified Nocardioides]TWH01880.1 hypothetical protein L615_001500000530 [Nocardioides sp. J9]